MGPEVLYLYLFSLNLQLTFFHENMPHSSLYEFCSPSSAIFCLKQATQLFTAFTEAGVMCSDSPQNHDCSSGFSHIQTPNCRDGTSKATLAGEPGSSAPPPRRPVLPWDQLPDTPRLPTAKGLPELLSSGSYVLLRKWHHLPPTLNTSSDAEALRWWPRRTSAVHLCQPSPPTMF